jgi:CHASE3 domain sensor protein
MSRCLRRPIPPQITSRGVAGRRSLRPTLLYFPGLLKTGKVRRRKHGCMFLKPLSAQARFLVWFAMTTPILLVAVACVLAFSDRSRMDNAFGWVRHTLQVENRIHELLLHMSDVQAGQRGYLLTGRTAYLESYRTGVSRITEDLERLRQQLAVDAAQQVRLNELEALALDHVSVVRQAIDMENVGRHDAALKLVRSELGKNTDKLRSVAAEMSRHEEALLQGRDGALAGRRRTHARWLYALLALNLASLACTVVLLQRLSNAQSLARVCAWSRRIEHDGQWLSFEDYLRRCFDIRTTHTISPDEVDRLLSEAAPSGPGASLKIPTERLQSAPRRAGEH